MLLTFIVGNFLIAVPFIVLLESRPGQRVVIFAGELGNGLVESRTIEEANEGDYITADFASPAVEQIFSRVD